MKHHKTILTAACLISIPQLAMGGTPQHQSQDQQLLTTSDSSSSDHCFGLGLQAGIQGVGLHARYDLNERLYFKLEGNYFQYDDDFDISGNRYSGEIDFSNFGLTANYLPFENGFRVTLGAYVGNNEATGVASGNGQTVSIGGNNYVLSPGDRLNGTVAYNQFAPYLGIGWDFEFGETSAFVFGVDLGVLYLGEPDTAVTASGPITAVPGFGADLLEEQALFAEDIEDYQFLPVLKLSLTYRF